MSVASVSAETRPAGNCCQARADRIGLSRTAAKRVDQRGRLAGSALAHVVLLYGDESDALTHPYLARAWAKSGADLRVPARDLAGGDLRTVLYVADIYGLSRSHSL
jgi:hypothetical protein